MNLLGNFRNRTKKRLEREAENWRAPRTMAGQNIGLVEAGYYAIVLIVALAMNGFAQKSPAVQVLVFGAAVVALSAHVRRAAIPTLYDTIGPKFGWPPFSEAIKEELAANGEKSAVEPQPPAAASSHPAPAVAESLAEPEEAAVAPAEPLAAGIRPILAVYASLSKTERRSRSLEVIAHLRTSFHMTFPEVDEEEEDQAKRLVGDAALMNLFRKEHAA